MDIERKGLFMGEPTNAERAQRAARVLTDYKRRHDPGEDAENVEISLGTSFSPGNFGHRCP